MIRYALVCDQAHDFESWFPSGDAFEEQRARGLVECPVCGSAKVEKRLMAPAIARHDRAAQTLPAPAAETGQQAPAPAESATPAEGMALLGEREQALRAMIREIHAHVTRNAENVGGSFVTEARRMHYGEVQERPIYGEASPDEARELIEEGVPVQPLPGLPDDRN
ncbi:MAG: hypothetical protein HLUCCO17_07920 [Saliniramus fredricksonii]|uniref:DUF1178 family protein n=1 Tax=Saliniramus fredricksonii TaxID=1653334 RepID=A0A0P7Y3L5_9HYPH|nr:DUF1178 family protein [Saliniramus fredricksonii]KPQ11055.1 MAG: hypothetical protein HLUCCO17_07920 [Saliniramus fredricksonii]SCC78029.1 hypothetical protein GA0071312_0042 [Saliniramus fredricksonii]